MHRQSRVAARRGGFSLLEILVVLTIIALLLSLVLVAVQAAREAANKVRCANNLRNLGQGMHHCHVVHKRLPSGGWGWNWTGEPDRGNGTDQPGGWCYNLLAYIEQDNLHDLGKGQPRAAMKAAAKIRNSTPVAQFVCPSRRSVKSYPNGWGTTQYNADTSSVYGRSDYAANCGSLLDLNEFFGGPGSLEQGDSPGYAWPDTSRLTGVFFQRSELSFGDITKGSGAVYAAGEKYLNPDNYFTGKDAADNECIYTGFNNDIYRDCYSQPRQDTRGYSNTFLYGSTHRTTFNMLFCDGSVKAIKYTIALSVHRAQGARN